MDGNEEKKRDEEEQERKEEGEKEKGVLTPALVILQQTAERGSKSSDAQLEGNWVGRDMVNILVQGLDGKHLYMKIAGGTRVSALCVDLAKNTGIPQDAFCLARQSKVLQTGDELWLEKNERLCMRRKLRGGMEGAWTCQHCGRQGCWATKVRCHRYGKSKFDPPNQQQADGNANVAGWIRTQARQQTEREWAQATRGAGVGSGTGGQPLGQKPPQPQQQGQRPQHQRQKSQTQSRAPSPAQEEDWHEVLLASLNGLIPRSLLEQVRLTLPKPDEPLTERMMQVQNKLDEEKKAANSWREAVKAREAALMGGRKILADHLTKVEGLQAEMSSLETQFNAQRKEKEEQERKEEERKLAATQVDIEQIPILEDLDMEDNLSHSGKKRRGRPVEATTYEQIEASILLSMEALDTKPEDYFDMIQRCLAKKAQQQMENGESSKHSKSDVKENGNVAEDPNL